MEKPITAYQARREVDVTPAPADAEGMQIPLGAITHEKAPQGEHSALFMPARYVMAFGAGVGTTIIHSTPNIPRSWCVFVNRNSAAGALVQVVSSAFDVTLAGGDFCIFPGRMQQVTLVNTVAAADVTIVALGDDALKVN